MVNRLTIRQKFMFIVTVIAGSLAAVTVAFYSFVSLDTTRIEKIKTQTIPEYQAVLSLMTKLENHRFVFESLASERAVAKDTVWIEPKIAGSSDFKIKNTRLVERSQKWIDDYRRTFAEGGAANAKQVADLRNRLDQLLEDLRIYRQDIEVSYQGEYSYIKRRLDLEKYTFPLMMGLLTLVLPLGVLIVLASVLRRIRRLSAHFSHIDLNHLEPIPFVRDDELGELVKASNEMIAKIRESRAELVEKDFVDKVIETLNEMLIVIDANGKVIRMNQYSLDKLHYSSLEDLNDHAFADLMVLESIDFAFDEMLQALQNNEVIRANCQMKDNSGDVLDVSLSASPIYTNEEFQGAVISIRNLTDFVKAEKDKQSIQAQLQQASKLAALGTMGAGVAHELNNPLSGVRGFADMICHKPDDPQMVEDFAKKIIKASKRMQKIVNHLRVFSRDSNKDDYQTLNVNEIINDSMMLIHRQFDVSGIDVEIRFEDPIHGMLGDSSSLESIFHNLLSNSRDAFTELTEKRERFVKFETYSDNEFVYVDYEDNAGGIPSDVIKNIFDPFFTTKKAGKGTGIGLSITLSIVEDHNGVIEVDSVAGQGTKFKIKFPANKETLWLPNMEEESEFVLQKSQRNVNQDLYSVLVIDDEKLVTEILTTYLDEDFNVTAFESPKEAVKAATKHQFDLIITDMRMPEMSGTEVIEAIRDFDQDTPIIVCSGHANTQKDLERFQSIGANYLVSKPLPSRVEFVDLINDIIATAKGEKVA